jgi:molecular chaperone GrpE
VRDDDLSLGRDQREDGERGRRGGGTARSNAQGQEVPDTDVSAAEESGLAEDALPEAAPDTERPSAAANAQRALEELRDKYLRLAAEYDNYRKRATRERQEAGPRAQGDLVKGIMDSLDDLARVTALDPATTDAAGIIDGVELVEKKLIKALTASGLEIINPVDQPFNPELHEAVATEPALSREDDHMVAQVYQPGYVFKGQLLRPARVVVKQWNG